MARSVCAGCLAPAVWLPGMTPPSPAEAPAAAKDHLDVRALGAKAEGKSDDTAAIQRALDAAARE